MIKFLKWMKKYKFMTLLLVLILLALPIAGAYCLCNAPFYTWEIPMEAWIRYFATFEAALAIFYMGSVSLWQAEEAGNKDILYRNTALLAKHDKAYTSTGNLFAPEDKTLKPYVEVTLKFQPQEECIPTGYILKKIDIKETLNSKSILSGKLVYADQIIRAGLTKEQSLECKIKIVDENLKKLKDSLILDGKLTFVKEQEQVKIATDYEYTTEVKFLGNTQTEITDIVLHQIRNSYYLK